MPKGLCFIINMYKYKHPYVDRKGSEIDSGEVRELFEHLGFTIYENEVHYDLKRNVNFIKFHKIHTNLGTIKKVQGLC